MPKQAMLCNLPILLACLCLLKCCYPWTQHNLNKNLASHLDASFGKHDCPYVPLTQTVVVWPFESNWFNSSQTFNLKESLKCSSEKQMRSSLPHTGAELSWVDSSGPTRLPWAHPSNLIISPSLELSLGGNKWFLIKKLNIIKLRNSAILRGGKKIKWVISLWTSEVWLWQANNTLSFLIT